jgi:hypothetical protein
MTARNYLIHERTTSENCHVQEGDENSFTR